MRCRISVVVMVLCGLWCAPSCVYGQEAGYFEQGNALYNSKKYEEAVSSYIRAIQQHPRTQPKAYLNCARAYSMLKNYAASERYYGFYLEVNPSGASDRKVMAEYKAVQKKVSGGGYVRDVSQTSVLEQVERMVAQGGPYWTRQGNGALAYYDVLLRTGFAEPKLARIQADLVVGTVEELKREVTPLPGQPLANLDRVGWEYIRTKIGRIRNFSDVETDMAFLEVLETTARAWEAYYRGDYGESREGFSRACQGNVRLPVAYWGRVILSFQYEDNEVLLEQISEAEKVYEERGVTGVGAAFALLRAQAYRNLGDLKRSLEWLDNMQGAL